MDCSYGNDSADLGVSFIVLYKVWKFYKKKFLIN